MALDDAAALEAATNAATAMGLPAAAAPQLQKQFKALLDVIVKYGIVDPTAGDTPMTVSVSGTPTPVTGSGKIT